MAQPKMCVGSVSLMLLLIVAGHVQGDVEGEGINGALSGEFRESLYTYIYNKYIIYVEHTKIDKLPNWL